MTAHDFSFAAHAAAFDQHIRDSIPGLDDLDAICVDLSRFFVQNGTTVVDIGCSTGRLLASIRANIEPSRPAVNYVGIDAEQRFSDRWSDRSGRNLRFEVCDARSFAGFQNLSLALSFFTAQFIPCRDKLTLLRRVYHGLNEGGALIIAEKLHANSGKFEEMLTSSYYNFKRETFTAGQILDKQLSLRGQMTLWTDDQLRRMLCSVGFSESDVQRIWQNRLFVAMVAEKGVRARRSSIAPVSIVAA